MSTPDKEPTVRSAIAEAIRAKRGERNPIPASDIEAMESALLAEIEAFERLTFNPTTPNSSSENNLPLVPREEASLFPKIIAEGVQRLPQAQPAAQTEARETSSTLQAAAPPAPKLGVLEQLRQQVQAQQQSDSVKERERVAQEKLMDTALRSIFSYCHELVQQLNILHPPIQRDYSLFGSFVLSNLEWSEGFADYRTRPDSAAALYEAVSLSAQLAKPAAVQIERDCLSAENYRKSLFDLGLVFTCEEIKNARQMVEKVVFSISAEVRINLRWRADPDRGILVLETRNLERFGGMVYEIRPESVGQAMLDELARLLLGQPSRFREFCSTLRPSAHSR